MPAQRGIGCVGIAFFNGIDDFRVISHHGHRLALDRQMQTAQAVDMAAQSAHEVPELRYARGLIHLPMESLVER
jgi:hypothetical protein